MIAFCYPEVNQAERRRNETAQVPTANVLTEMHLREPCHTPIDEMKILFRNAKSISTRSYFVSTLIYLVGAG